MKPETSRVYVAPSKMDVFFHKGSFELKEMAKERIAPSIDIFFEDLAEEKRFMAIGVILSGTGHDGTAGIEKIRKNGGYVICQIPSSASSRGMPQSAIDTRQYDILLKPTEIFREIKHYMHNYNLINQRKTDDMVGKNAQDLILELLTEKTGTHFSQYKKNTISRRINKRMETLGLDEIGDYYFYIRRTPKELDDLFETLLIGVTEFFRDKSVFRALESILINMEKNKSKTFRIWSVGCATGEEPYSLAIMMLELMENQLPQYDLQIFATDIHERALKIARNGIYGLDQLKNIPGRLIEKYFEKIPEGYEIKRKVRQNVLFTKHDITGDPPFIRLDLIACRNLMIYFNAELQRQILKLFSYALNPEGLLLMGKSENVNDLQFFESIDPANKIFLRSDGEPMHGHLHSKPYHKKENVSTSYPGNGKKEFSLKDIIKETLLNTFEHPFLIVDEQNRIREIYGSVRLFLELKDGGMNADITKMVNPEIQLDLRVLLVKVKKEQQTVKSRVIRFKLFDKDYEVILEVKPLLYLYGKNSYYMVIFELSDEIPTIDENDHDVQNVEHARHRIKELEEELSVTSDQLQTFTEELEASNEELQAMNEELQSANEELKSSNEELETSNEELLSANEELSSSNIELRKINENILEKDKELKNLYEKLEGSEQRFKYLADNAPAMIWMADPDMVGKYFNKRWLEFTGKEVEKMDPEKGFELLHPDDVEPFRQAYARATREKSEFIFEYRLRKKDGTFNWVQCRGVPRYASSGEFLGFIGANTNIHDIKTLEEKKDEFMSIAGHELKTPMTTSLAYLQLMEEEIKGLHNENLEYYLRKMTNSMHKMHNLIIDLLEVSRIEANRLNLNLEEIDFDQMIREYVEDYRHILPERKLIVEGSTKSRIIGDKHRLDQLINNLLSNAAKFSRDDTPINIHLRRENHAVELVIRDHGIGIPNEYSGKIFERFFQVGEGKYKSGMGVGLFICKEIIERHEGRIRVESAENRGTSFIVQIPVKE